MEVHSWRGAALHAPGIRAACLMPCVVQDRDLVGAWTGCSWLGARVMCAAVCAGPAGAGGEKDPVALHGVASATRLVEESCKDALAAEQKQQQLRLQQKQRRQRLAQPPSRRSLHEQHQSAQQAQGEGAGAGPPEQLQQHKVLTHPVALNLKARRKSAVGCEATGVCMMGPKQREQVFGPEPGPAGLATAAKHFSDIVIFNDMVLGKVCAGRGRAGVGVRLVY